MYELAEGGAGRDRCANLRGRNLNDVARVVLGKVGDTDADRIGALPRLTDPLVLTAVLQVGGVQGGSSRVMPSGVDGRLLLGTGRGELRRGFVHDAFDHDLVQLLEGDASSLGRDTLGRPSGKV